MSDFQYISINRPSDFLIYLKAPENWKSVRGHDELLAALEKEFGKFLGVTYEFSQPIEMRMNELIAGVRSDIAIQIFGEDMATLAKTADQVVASVAQIPGARGFRAQQISGLPMIEIAVRPNEIARYGINAASFTIPASGQGDLGRNALRGCDAVQLDTTLRRQFHLTERMAFQARADFFNIFNHPNFGPPTNYLSSPLFGQSTQMLGASLGSGGQNGGLNPLYQIGGPRSAQLALKLLF